MSDRYANCFIRDKKPIVDIFFKIFQNIIFVGDVLNLIFERKRLDEVRFYKREMALIKGNEITSYRYNQLRATVGHFLKKGRENSPSIQIFLKADDGKEYKFYLSGDNSNIFLSSFSDNPRAFLFQAARRLPRLKEQRYKEGNIYLQLACISVLLIIVLVS